MTRPGRLFLFLAALACVHCTTEGDDDDGGGASSASSSGMGGGSSSSGMGGGSSSSGTGGSSSSSGTGGSSSSSSSSSSGGPAGPYQQCVDLINQYRAGLNLPPYQRWTSAESCSDGEAESDAASGVPHGAFGTCGEWAQNECPGWPGPPANVLPGCLQMMWDEGPGGGHYDNMSSTKYIKAACGFYQLPNGDVWAVQNFK